VGKEFLITKLINIIIGTINSIEADSIFLLSAFEVLIYGILNRSEQMRKIPTGERTY
jgi:hypothetical protein